MPLQCTSSLKLNFCKRFQLPCLSYHQKTETAIFNALKKNCTCSFLTVAVTVSCITTAVAMNNYEKNIFLNVIKWVEIKMALTVIISVLVENHLVNYSETSSVSQKVIQLYVKLVPFFKGPVIETHN